MFRKPLGDSGVGKQHSQMCNLERGFCSGYTMKTQRLHYFAFLPTVHKVSNLSASLTTFAIFFLLKVAIIICVWGSLLRVVRIQCPSLGQDKGNQLNWFRSFRLISALKISVSR